MNSASFMTHNDAQCYFGKFEVKLADFYISLGTNELIRVFIIIKSFYLFNKKHRQKKDAQHLKKFIMRVYMITCDAAWARNYRANN